MQDLRLNDFPIKSYDKLRYADTDKLGHVNNAVFSTFLETGRVEFFFNSSNPITSEHTSFVIASLKLDFVNEVHWPGQVEIGTGFLKSVTAPLFFFK
ncbi:acyl-CoA thioesterase [Mangrovivirga cuniculi]|uniref:acyl-CoA thioesterase n=1 Tax=Mangrovivirga cuniculi TaxID=2715131 RepID=UPI001C2FA14B|nr:acyl-CoA thioesterase [Mangrovivirga cuniculi]